MEEFLRPIEVYTILRVSYKTLWVWIKTGKLKAIRLPSGRYRIPKSELERLKRELQTQKIKQKNQNKKALEKAINNLPT